MGSSVKMIGITKTYPGALANDNVDFTARSNEIHGIIGENGAGKSTLMGILYGIVKPDKGKILINEKEVCLSFSHQAIKLGIGMVHQHFMLVPSLTVAQNIILGFAPKKAIFIDFVKAKKRIRQILDQYSLHIDLEAKVSQLSVGQRQRVEIVKCLYRDAGILIMDEPTAVLSPQETASLLDTFRTLKRSGCSIIFISHKLKEVLACATKITVMRKGKVTGVVSARETNQKQLNELMIGKVVNLTSFRRRPGRGKKILEVKNLRARNARGGRALAGVGFTVHRQEILGIAGVEGNGQTELAEALSGLSRPEKGEIYFMNRPIQSESVKKRREAGIAHIPEDRLKIGAALSCAIEDNLVSTKFFKKPFSRKGWLIRRAIKEFSQKLVKDYNVKTSSTKSKIASLSGGNAQKVILAREAEHGPDFLIASQPTRGVDIGAIEYIYEKLLELRNSGKAILLVSYELDEIKALADRVLVFYEGEIVGRFDRGNFNELEIGLYMTGVKRDKFQAGDL